MREAKRRRAASTHSVFASRKTTARRSETYVGNDSRTSPEGRTESDMRRARAVRESVTSPSVGWCSVVYMLTCGS